MTALLLSKKVAPDRILLLVFNMTLRRVTRANALNLGCENLEVHTLHSFFNHYYKLDNGEAIKDDKMSTTPEEILSVRESPILLRDRS